ncbi:MAG: GntR family transcriptional repressor for pyruvate dehydrogenase complex [Cellvibrionaceae bacterium]|jgi:GntR family transcriptional repressor for pyruvate dehydrogenase complex
MLTAVSKDTLTHQAADTLKRYILSEDLAEGTQLPSERELSEMLAVSRNIIRESLSTLVALGVVEKFAGKGTFVSKFDRHAVHISMPITVSQVDTTAKEVREARAALEIGAVGLIVSRITPSEITNLEKILQVYEDKHSAGKSTIKEDIEFHLALLKATKNKVIEEMAPLVYDMFRRTLSEDPSAIRRNPDRIVIEHRRIVDALRAADVVAARFAMHAHFRLQDFPV